jgi:hypothetical protein
VSEDDGGGDGKDAIEGSRITQCVTEPPLVTPPFQNDRIGGFGSRNCSTAMGKRKPKPDPKPCELCVEDMAILGERYCKACRKIKLSEMQSAGYLAPRPIGHVGQSRTSEMKEVQHETRSGTWHG